MTKPTKGPYHADHSGERIAVYAVDGRRVFLGSFSERGIGRREAEANAELFVRAVNAHTDLLAAAHAALDNIYTRGEQRGPLDEQLSAAIEKAGEKQEIP